MSSRPRVVFCRLLPHALLLLLFQPFPAPVAGADCAPPLCVTSADGGVVWTLGGRLRFDATDFHDDNDTGLRDGTNVRRARLSQRLTVGDSWSAGITWDFTDDGIDGLRNATLRYSDPAGLRLTLGHFKQPFGMEQLTSVRDLGYMERSLSSELTLGRALGGEVRVFDTHWSAALGLFGSQPTKTMDSRFGAAARTTLAPLSDNGKVLHLGVALAYRDLTGDGELRFRRRPGSSTTDLRLVDSGTLQGRDVTYYGVEAALARGPFSAQSEYLVSRVDRAGGQRNLYFDGWYLDLGWILTGEQLPYDHADGTFGRITPAGSVFKGHTGAWMLGLRLDSLNLGHAEVDGGRQRDLTAGVTWYMAEWIRLNAEYVRVLETRGGAFDGSRPSLVQGAVEVFF